MQNSMAVKELEETEIKMFNSFHEVAITLTSLDMISKNPLVNSTVLATKKATEKFEETGKKVALYKQQLQDKKDEYQENLARYLSISYASLSVDRLYEKVGTGRDAIKTKFSEYVDSETLYHPFVVARDFAHEFRNSKESTIDLILLNKQAAQEYLEDKKNDFCIFINERKYKEYISKENLERLETGFGKAGEGV